MFLLIQILLMRGHFSLNFVSILTVFTVTIEFCVTCEISCL